MRNKRNHARHPIVLILAVAGLIGGTTVFLPSAGLAIAQAAGPSWTVTGSLGTARYGHTATLLPNGKVLVVGGWGFGYLDFKGSAELYDPTTGIWSHTGSLNTPRYAHTATLLPNRNVLVAGGWGGTSSLKSAELYDPATGQWTMTGSLIAARNSHTATLLTNGKVLVVGGDSSNAPVNTAELYDAATGTWSGTDTPRTISGRHSTAVMLPNGKVLATGNSLCSNAAELYDPVTEKWSVTNPPHTFGCADTATLLPNGKVLVTISRFVGSISADLYDPTTQGWSVGGMLNRFHGGAYTATLLRSGQILVAGGNYDQSYKEADVYDPRTATWNPTSSLNDRRGYHTATLLPNGRVLVAGGADGDFDIDYTTLSSAELFDLTPGSNPINETQFFVRQQYLDFLNREPDQSGWDFWMNEITSCGDDQQCIEVKRINVSAAYFLSIEFQQTGYLAYRMCKTAYGNLPDAPVPVKFNDFLTDTQEIGHGVVVLQPSWETVLENNKQAFSDEFVNRSRFMSAYPSSMTAADFVDKLNSNAGNPLSQMERDHLVSDLTTGAQTRAQVLRAVAENQNLFDAEFNRAFVLMQYFGYLRRDPNAGPETDFSGYNFWLNKLNAFNGDFASAEMVKAFISSSEYRQRFGP